MLDDFLLKTKTKDLVIGILGLGYVGIPLAQRCAEVGFKVVGIDINEARVEGLNAGKSPIQHITHEEIELMVSRGFSATADFSAVVDCDAIIICVPTPLSKKREPDLSYVVATMEAVSPYLRKGHLVSLESTTWPGTTDEILRPYLEKADLNIGEDAFLVYSPEREDPGNAHFNTKSIPKVLGGQTAACTQAGTTVYEVIVDKVVSVSSTRAAEMVKLLENIHRSVNIGLVNEMKIVCQKMGLDVFEVIDAAATKPFGFTPYYPGPGIGGHCIPIDPFYLTWKAREYGVQTRFIEIAGEINASMPQYVVDHLVKALNARGLALKGAKILVLGIAYKKNVDDMRESPSVFIMELLRDLGANISYHDPNVPVFPDMREHNFDLWSVPLTAEIIQESDAVLVLTNHTDVDYDLIQKNACLIIDTRGQYRGSNAMNIQRA